MQDYEEHAEMKQQVLSLRIPQNNDRERESTAWEAKQNENLMI